MFPSEKNVQAFSGSLRSSCADQLFVGRTPAALAPAQPGAEGTAPSDSSATGPTTVAYFVSDKKRDSLLTNEFVERARCGCPTHSPWCSLFCAPFSPPRLRLRGLRFVPVDPYTPLQEQVRRGAAGEGRRDDNGVAPERPP